MVPRRGFYTFRPETLIKQGIEAVLIKACVPLLCATVYPALDAVQGLMAGGADVIRKMALAAINCISAIVLPELAPDPRFGQL
jgi:hypothetical protein